jgi:hypothetical protein
VRGNGIRFEAPAGWKVTTSRTSASAAHESQLLQVTTFPLVKTYRDALFDKVARELDLRMRAVAEQLHGTVRGTRTVTVDGIRAHHYDVGAGEDVYGYTFVLQVRREYELLCRRPSSADDAPCTQLLTTFVLR